MMFNSWLKDLKSTCGLGSSKRMFTRPRATNRPTGHRLQVEALEDRFLLSTHGY